MPSTRIRLICALIAGMAASLPLTGIASAQVKAPEQAIGERAADTPDGYARHIKNAAGSYFGTVYWNDYKNSNHSVDIDNIYLKDQGWNGTSVKITVYWKGKKYKAHAYDGKLKKIDIGNVPNNKKVYYKACGSNDGNTIGCTAKEFFKE